MIGAALGHLLVVDPGELGILAAGSVGGAEQRGAQQRRAGLAHRLALAVGVAGLAGPRRESGIGLEPGRVAEPAGTAHDRDQDRGADFGEPRQRPGQLARIDGQVVLLAGGGVQRKFVLDGAQQPHLGGDLGGQLRIRYGRVIAVELDGGGRGVLPLPRPGLRPADCSRPR